MGGSNVDGEHDIGQGGDEMDSTLASHGIVDEVGGEEIVEISGATQATTSCRSSDHRRWCIRCTYKIRIRSDDGKDKPKNVSRIEGMKPKKTNDFCMRCKVALCEECFRPWHEDNELPPNRNNRENVLDESENVLDESGPDPEEQHTDPQDPEELTPDLGEL